MSERTRRSDDFFGRNENMDQTDKGAHSAKMQKYSGARGISSDMYFDRARADSGRADSGGIDEASAADFFAELGAKVTSDVTLLAEKARAALR